MSENLDLVRSIYAAWERGDFSPAEWADPAIEFVRVGGVSAGSVTGTSGMAAAWSSWLDVWEDFRARAEEYRDLGERVLVLTDFSGAGKTSGIELDQMQTRGAHLFHISDGKVVKLVTYWDRDRALADLGLAE